MAPLRAQPLRSLTSGRSLAISPNESVRGYAHLRRALHILKTTPRIGVGPREHKLRENRGDADRRHEHVQCLGRIRRCVSFASGDIPNILNPRLTALLQSFAKLSTPVVSYYGNSSARPSEEIPVLQRRGNFFGACQMIFRYCGYEDRRASKICSHEIGDGVQRRTRRS
jgi:hypothetical protein